MEPYAHARPKRGSVRQILRAHNDLQNQLIHNHKMKNQMKNNINKDLKKCLIYPHKFLKFIRKINVKYLMNNNKILSLIII